MARSVRSNNNKNNDGRNVAVTTIASSAANTINTTISNNHMITYPEWLERKRQVEERLKVVSIPSENKKSKSNTATMPNNKRTRGGGTAAIASASVAAEKATVLTQEKEQETATAEKQINSNMNVISIPYIPKKDVHWDFVMKEMMWLGADFKGERKRQNAAAKKLAYSVQKFHETKEKRRLRQLQQAEMKRKKLAAKISRDVKGWWIKLEKVVAYKQKKKLRRRTRKGYE